MKDNGIWLIKQDKHILIRTWKGQYKIEQENAVSQIKGLIPIIENTPVLLGKNDNVSSKNAEKWKQIRNQIEKMIQQRENNIQSKVLKVDPAIFIYKGKSQKDLISEVMEYEENTFCLIFSLKEGCVVAKGNKAELINKINMFQEKDFETDIDRSLLKIAMYKAYEFLNMEKNLNKSFYIVTRENISIQEKYELVDIYEHNKEQKSLRNLIIPESRNIHQEINELKQVIKKMSFYILNWGFEELNQIPFKIAEFTYIKGNFQKKYYAAGEEPGEVFVRSFKMGMADMLNSNLKEKYGRWVVAQDKEDILISGAVPVVFDYINDKAAQFIEMEEVDMEAADNIVKVLLKQVDTHISLKDIEMSIQCIKGTKLKKGTFRYAKDKSLKLVVYGLDKEIILNSLLIDFYAAVIQNNLTFKLEKILLEGGNNNILRGKKRESYYKVLEEEMDKVYEIIGGKSLKVSSWKYNDIFRKSNMNCLFAELA